MAGTLRRRAEDRRLVANIDLAPTILQAAGIAPDSPMDGRSLLRSWDRTRLLTEFWKLPGYYVPTWASIRTKTYQFIEYYGPDGQIIDREFYDLVADPWQLTNLVTDSNRPDPAGIRHLHDLLLRDRTCAGGSCP